MEKYKVLIVDDEKPARQIIKSIINWEELGFEICGEAKNGREAIEIYHMKEPDIVITDIQMPIMNGLELIKEIREIDREIKIIVLSCYEDFSYAREAFLMGVEDYLIKDLLKKEELIQILCNSINEQKQDSTEEYQDKSLEYLKNNEELIDYLSSKGSKEFKPNIDMESSSLYRVIIISFDDYNRNDIIPNEYEKEKIKSNLIRLIEGFNIKEQKELIVSFAYIGKGKAVVIIKTLKSLSESLKLKSTMEIVNRIKNSYKKIDDEHTISMAISSELSNIEEVYNKYIETCEILKYRLFMGKNKIIFHNTPIPKLTQMSELDIHMKLNTIKEAIERNDKKDAIKYTKELYNENIKGFLHYNFLKEVNGQMFVMISDICIKNEIDLKELIGTNYFNTNILEDFDTVEEIIQWFDNCIENLIVLIKNKTNYSRHIKDAINYIHENYSEHIALNDISDSLNIHKVYLSRIFKEETGNTISNYILGYKIQKAKELIDTTNYKIYEIAEKTGFSNAQHFVVSFKKVVGVTPKDYKGKKEK